MKIIAKEKRIVRQLNQSKTCGAQPTSWQLGVGQDVTSTNGCPVLGFVVPRVEQDIVQMDRRVHQTLLLVGQRPSDGGDLTTADRLPTSFQPPLVRCADGGFVRSASGGAVERRMWSSAYNAHHSAEPNSRVAARSAAASSEPAGRATVLVVIASWYLIACSVVRSGT